MGYLAFVVLAFFQSGWTQTDDLKQAGVSDFFSPYHEKYPVLAHGLRVVIRAEVNGKMNSRSHVVINFKDQVRLRAIVLENGRKLNRSQVDDRFETTYWWYKVFPHSRAYNDPAAIGDYSEEAQYFYKSLGAFNIPMALKFKHEKFVKEYSGKITPDFEQGAVSDYAEKNQSEYLGTLRWKVLVKFRDKATGESFYVTSPDERYLNGDFDKINYSATKKVFLLARRGGTPYKRYNEALSYLGLPYIWWRRDVKLRLGSTCSQFVSYVGTGRQLNTAGLFKRPGITITGIEAGKFKGKVRGKEVFLEYGKHVQPGNVIVYRFGLKERHAAVIGDDHGTEPGYLDENDMMIHGIIGGILGGNFFKDGIEYVPLKKRYNSDKVIRYRKGSKKPTYIMKIVK